MSKCLLCGMEDDGVRFHNEYVGGVGYGETGPTCEDETACWGRFDEANGLKVEQPEPEAVPA